MDLFVKSCQAVFLNLALIRFRSIFSSLAESEKGEEELALRRTASLSVISPLSAAR